MSKQLSKEESQKCSKLIEMLLQEPDSLEFRHAVDWKGLGLEDYPIVIKKPMDLTLIKNKLKKAKYANLNEFLGDIELIWENCKTYNMADSPIYKLAETMQKCTKKHI